MNTTWAFVCEALHFFNRFANKLILVGAPSRSRTASVLHYCRLRSEISFWKHKTSCWSQSTCYWRRPSNLPELERGEHFKQCDGWSRSAAWVQQTCTVCWLWISVFIWDFISFQIGSLRGLISRWRRSLCYGKWISLNLCESFVQQQEQQYLHVAIFHHDTELCTTLFF